MASFFHLPDAECTQPEELERKTSFFEQLYAIDSDDEEDIEEEAGSVRLWLQNSTRRHKRASTRQSSQQSSQQSFQQSPPPNSSSSQRQIQAVRTPVTSTTKIPDLLRTVSEPTSSTVSSTVVKETPVLLPRQRFSVSHKGTPLAKEVTFVEETPSMARSGQPARRFSSPTVRGNAKTLGKRKREESLVMVPDNRRIFNDLHFFYIPDDDVSPARRAQIKKAREHGAIWARVYDTDVVTHIIVEKGLTYEDVAKFLKLPSPPKDIVLVNEEFPLDCMQHGGILDHTKNSYLLPGYQEAVDQSRAKSPPRSNVSENSDKSLQVSPGYRDSVPTKSASPESPGEDSTQRPTPVQPIPEFHSSSQPERLSTSHGTSTSAIKHGELDEIIQETKKVEHFLDDEEDEMAEAGDESDGGHSSPERKPKASRKKKNSSDVAWQENFSCMKGGTVDSIDGNPNARTIEILQQMTNYYTNMNDHWRSIAYRKAMASLKGQSTKITTYEEAFALPNVGSRLAEKIEEIVRTNHLRRLDNANLEPQDKILQEFLNIYGVGRAIASKWVAQGYTTRFDLLKNPELTPNQRIGIEKYDDFLTRIPREEVTALGDVVKETARTIDPDVNIIIGGSYRRGAKDSGDIDLVVTKPAASVAELNPFLNTLVSTLTTSGFLVAPLAVSRSEEGTKWHGCCILPNQAKQIWRRIDFLLVPDCELGAALIYFTGNDIFNRSIRLLASRKKMRLNQRGLYKDVMRGVGRVKLNEGELLEGHDERRIFELLGVPWRRPEDRIC